MRKPESVLSLDDRLWSKVIADPGSGCWLWGGSVSRGYGQIKVGGAMRPAHRVMYERERGPVPAGLHIDHLCKNTLCVRPDHLEPVTPRENARRSECVSTIHARKTHCVKGHPLSGDNLYTRTTGWRACRQCGRDANNKHRSALRLAHRTAAQDGEKGGGADA